MQRPSVRIVRGGGGDGGTSSSAAGGTATHSLLFVVTIGVLVGVIVLLLAGRQLSPHPADLHVAPHTIDRGHAAGGERGSGGDRRAFDGIVAPRTDSRIRGGGGSEPAPPPPPPAPPTVAAPPPAARFTRDSCTGCHAVNGRCFFGVCACKAGTTGEQCQHGAPRDCTSQPTLSVRIQPHPHRGGGKRIM